MIKSKRSTSWEASSKWYNKITGDKGHYFHQQVIIPNVLKLLSLSPNSNLIDFGCGNGVLGKSLPKNIKYTGVDISESLVRSAKKEDRNYSHNYVISDATLPLRLTEVFTHSTMILSLQNMRNPEGAIKNISMSLAKDGILVIILNHPFYRIPRQTSWQIDEKNKTQFRRVDKYMSTMEIPINTNPSDRNSPITLSFHYPLWLISKMLKSNGFVIELIEEWTSDKESTGRASKMENRARQEIPLFLAIKARKV